MKVIAGVDIGNSTTEACLAAVDGKAALRFLSDSITATTGLKGTTQNTAGIRTALEMAARGAGLSLEDISRVLLNDAAPVIGGTAMETITETVITGSAMLGHNPRTPAGVGIALGELIWLEHLGEAKPGVAYIVIVSENTGYEAAAGHINRSKADIRGLMLQSDEAVLVYNRLDKKIPIIDEVRAVTKLPEGRLSAIEAAPMGESVSMLSNPYGIATLLGLTSEETRVAAPIAKSLTGSRSAAVIKTPSGGVSEQPLPAGTVYITPGDGAVLSVPIDAGADAIMERVVAAGDIADIEGEADTNIGHMLGRVKSEMLEASGGGTPRIRDLLAVDTLAPARVSGGLAGEHCLEKAVGVAAMVRTERLSMDELAKALAGELGVFASVSGVEAVMASLGALTTPGTELPLAILDLGGGSTDAALLDRDGTVRSVHLAGAGELVTLLIMTELGLASRAMAEDIKKHPLASVESMFHIRLETGEIRFFQEPLSPRLFGRVALVEGIKLTPIMEDLPMERIRQARREAKEKVFGVNALRALARIAPEGNIRRVPNVALVGGSAEDFELPQMLAERLAPYGIVCGRGNIRGKAGPRNAVATGLVMHWL